MENEKGEREVRQRGKGRGGAQRRGGWRECGERSWGWWRGEGEGCRGEGCREQLCGGRVVLWKGGTRLSSPRRGELWQCKVPCECPRAHRRGAARSEDLVGRTAAARSCRDTAKPSGWQDAQKPGWMLSAQTLLPSVLPYEHLQMDGAEGRWADKGAVCLNSLPPLAPCTISRLLHLFWEKAPVQQPQTLLPDFICAARSGHRRNGAGQAIKLLCVSSPPGKKISISPSHSLHKVLPYSPQALPCPAADISDSLCCAVTQLLKSGTAVRSS